MLNLYGQSQKFTFSIESVEDSDLDMFPPSREELRLFCAVVQVVLLGAGYDTRSLRYRNRADFFEVDLPEVRAAGVRPPTVGSHRIPGPFPR